MGPASECSKYPAVCLSLAFFTFIDHLPTVFMPSLSMVSLACWRIPEPVLSPAMKPPGVLESTTKVSPA